MLCINMRMAFEKLKNFAKRGKEISLSLLFNSKVGPLMVTTSALGSSAINNVSNGDHAGAFASVVFAAYGYYHARKQYREHIQQMDME